MSGDVCEDGSSVFLFSVIPICYLRVYLVVSVAG